MTGGGLLNYLMQGATKASDKAADVINPVGKAIGSQQVGVPGVASAPLSKVMDFLTAGKQGLGNKILAGKTSGEDVQELLPFIVGGIKVPEGGKVRITLKPSVHGAEREAAVQSTVDNLVPGATATEKYMNLQPTMDNLGKQISEIMSQNPKAASIDQVMRDYDSNLMDQGVYRTSHMPKDEIQKTARGYINDLQREAEGEANGAINPSQISDVGLQKIKQQVNQDAQSIFKKIENGTSLTEKDKVILAARQTVDDALTNLHPEVKDLTTKQSHLYDAADSLYKGREAEVKAADQAPKGALNKILNFTRNHPGIGLLGAAGIIPGIQAGAAAASKQIIPGLEVAGERGMEALNGILGKGSPQQQQEGQPDQGQVPIRYSAQDPMASGLLMNQNDFQSQKGKIQASLDYAKQYNLPIAGQLQGQLDQLQTRYDAEKPLRDKWSNENFDGVSQQMQIANEAFNSVQHADPGFFNALQGGYDNLQKVSNGKYAAMAANLEALTKLTGTDFTTASSKEALSKKIDQAVNNIKTNWGQQLQSYYGQKDVDSERLPVGPARNIQQTPQGQSFPSQGGGGLPPGFNFGSQL